MAIDLGFSGQESDVNRACSAFGLDTVNYRAFPNNGPVPVAESAAIPAAAAPVPVAAIPVPPPIPIAPVAPQQIQPPVPVPHLAPVAPPAAFSPVTAQPWTPAPVPQWAQTAASGPAVAPGTYPTASMPPAPPAAPYPAPQPQNEALPGGFSLLRQALPAAYLNPGAPMPAFAMARAPLQPLPSVVPQALQPAGPIPANQAPANSPANPESFGIAFGTAFNAAFGPAEAGSPGSGVQRPQT